MKQMFKSFWADESGQGLTEYALIIVLVSIALVVALTIFKNQLAAVFTAISAALQQPIG